MIDVKLKTVIEIAEQAGEKIMEIYTRPETTIVRAKAPKVNYSGH